MTKIRAAAAEESSLLTDGGMGIKKRVEEDVDRLPEQRPGAHTDEDHDHEAKQGVDIVPEAPVGEPDHGGTDEDHHASQGVSHHVQEHALVIE